MNKHSRVIALLLVLCLVPALASGCFSAKKETPEIVTEAPSSQIAPRDPSGDLLLLVDFQNVYLPGNDWACPSMPEAIEKTIRILNAENAPDYVLTRYIAPSDPHGRWKQYNEAYRDINENEYLSEIVDELIPYAESAPVMDKSTYSSMDVEEVIAAMDGKTAVVLTGVVADCCVLATMMDAIDLGYEVVYLYDCIGGTSAESEAEFRALAEIYSPIHTTIMSADEYIAAISGGMA